MTWREESVHRHKHARGFHNNQINNHWYPERQVVTWADLSDGKWCIINGMHPQGMWLLEGGMIGVQSEIPFSVQEALLVSWVLNKEGWRGGERVGRGGAKGSELELGKLHQEKAEAWGIRKKSLCKVPSDFWARIPGFSNILCDQIADFLGVWTLLNWIWSSF